MQMPRTSRCLAAYADRLAKAEDIGLYVGQLGTVGLTGKAISHKCGSSEPGKHLHLF